MAAAPRRKSRSFLTCLTPPPLDVQGVLVELERCECPVYGVYPLTVENIKLLEKNVCATFKRQQTLGWSEQKVLVKVSPEGKYPLEFHSTLKYMMDLRDRLTAVLQGLYTESFFFKLERVSTYRLEGGASVNVAEQVSTDLSAKFTKERKLMNDRDYEGDPSYPLAVTALEDPVLEELGIVKGLRGVVTVFPNSSDWESKEFHDSNSLDLQVSKELNIGAGGDGVAVSASGAQVVSETFEWELNVKFYASTRQDRQLIKNGLEKSYWATVDLRCAVISKLYKQREAECERFSWGNFMGKTRPFTSPFQLMLAGKRFSCKTSILWSIQIAEGGWASPVFRVRPAINGGAEQYGTTVPNEFALQQFFDGELFCKVLDFPGENVSASRSERPTKELEPHQFVVLVIEVEELFSKDGLLVNDFLKTFQSLPYSKDATMILLTKWDLLLYETPSTNTTDLASRLDEMWQDQAMLNAMEQCCLRLRDALGGEKGPSIRYQRTPIWTDDTPSLGTVQAIQKMSVAMLEDFFGCVCKRLKLTLGE